MSIKGVVIEKALPSNILDLYALVKQAAKEGAYVHPRPTPEQVSDYYFQLLEELAIPHTFVYLARKGRSYSGYIHGQVLQRPWSPNVIMFIKMCFVSEKRRKVGIAKGLIDRMIKDSKHMGIANFEFMANDQMCDYFIKKRGARKVLNYMVVEAK